MTQELPEGLKQRLVALAGGEGTLVVLTGAGISAESGIPTFRDPGGIWDQFDPEEFVEDLIGK